MASCRLLSDDLVVEVQKSFNKNLSFDEEEVLFKKVLKGYECSTLASRRFTLDRNELVEFRSFTWFKGGFEPLPQFSRGGIPRVIVWGSLVENYFALYAGRFFCPYFAQPDRIYSVKVYRDDVGYYDNQIPGLYMLGFIDLPEGKRYPFMITHVREISETSWYTDKYVSRANRKFLQEKSKEELRKKKIEADKLLEVEVEEEEEEAEEKEIEDEERECLISDVV